MRVSFLLLFVFIVATSGYGQSCLAAFEKTYNPGFVGYAKITTTDKNKFIVAASPIDASGNPQKGTIVSFDNEGKLLNAKKVLFGAGTDAIHDNERLRDGNFVFVNYLTTTNVDSSKILLHKYNEQLNAVWSKSYQLPFKKCRAFDLAETADGAIFLYFQISLTLTVNAQYCAVAKFDAAGNLLWCKGYQPTVLEISGAGRMVEMGGFLYFSCSGSPTRATTCIFKIEANAGNLVWSKAYNTPGRELDMARYMAVRGERVVLAGLYLTGSSRYQPGMLMLDEEGTVKQSATYVGGMYAIDALHATEDEIIIAGRYFGSGNAFYGALNDELRFKYLIGTANTFVPKGLNVTTTGSIIETGISGGQIFYLKKHIPNRKSSMCDSLPVVLTKVNELVNTAPLAVNTTSLTLPPAISSYSIVDHPMYSLPVNCSAISNCSSIVLSGIDKVCNGTEVYTYKAIKNGTCTSAIKWFYNKAAIQKVASDDSTISLRFLAQGSFKIKVRLMSGCEVPLDDSVIVNVGSGIGVDLGVDRMLCENNKVRISAGPHFSSYQWQDGSTDSFYTATKPGVYYVKATNACGYQYRDTVNIVAYINTGFNIGNNISKCNNDSVTVTAPSGYTNYSWTPANSISDATKQQINAFPAYTTRYYVKAKDQYGCSVSDSVLITVNRSKSVNLGNDTSLCIGNSIKLNAGEGFTYYRWSTYESNKEIIVKTAGTYFVYATDNNNCTSADSIQLLNVHPNPVVYLGNDTVICRGTSYNLNVGVYSSYLWSDNTSGRSIKVLQPGEYFVKVTDDKGCINSDTLHVTGYNELPSSFLPDTIKLCENEPVELKTSDKFVSYKWSTGSNQPSIHVASAGNYWLEVTNANGCRNRDTTYAVLKECFRLLYFPTAFTPNNDGKNDLFRPKVYGNLEKFHIVIYNKLGQKVFETTEPSQGWNGTIKGVPQDTQIFIWTSDFLFTGPNQKVKVEKGTITLLR